MSAFPYPGARFPFTLPALRDSWFSVYRKRMNPVPVVCQPYPHPFTLRPQPPDVPRRQLRPFDHALVENAVFCYSPQFHLALSAIALATADHPPSLFELRWTKPPSQKSPWTSTNIRRSADHPRKCSSVNSVTCHQHPRAVSPYSALCAAVTSMLCIRTPSRNDRSCHSSSTNQTNGHNLAIPRQIRQLAPFAWNLTYRASSGEPRRSFLSCASNLSTENPSDMTR